MAIRNLTDADCEKIAELVVPKLKASIMGDMQKEAGKGLFSLAWKAALIVMVWLAIYNLTGGFNIKSVADKVGVDEVAHHRSVEVFPPRDNPFLTQLAMQLDEMNVGDRP